MQSVQFTFISSDVVNNLYPLALICYDYNIIDGATSAKSGEHLDMQFLIVLRSHLFSVFCFSSGHATNQSLSVHIAWKTLVFLWIMYIQDLRFHRGGLLNSEKHYLLPERYWARFFLDKPGNKKTM